VVAYAHRYAFGYADKHRDTVGYTDGNAHKNGDLYTDRNPDGNSYLYSD
jgi:hypothetical protein